jgi:hypothetical protein
MEIKRNDVIWIRPRREALMAWRRANGVGDPHRAQEHRRQGRRLAEKVGDEQYSK